MGIKNLFKVIEKHAPSAIFLTNTSTYVNKRVAVDASVLLYQFLTSILKDGQPLRNQAGDVTSHILGLLARCTRLAEAGIKPIFVFDGRAGEEKADELQRRKELKEQAKDQAEKALERADMAEYERFQKRGVQVTPEMVQQAKRLLELLGIPYVQAPGEAEILCVSLLKHGLVDAVSSSDLDCVCHGAACFVRNLATDKQVVEIRHAEVLSALQMTQEQFIDFCILLGCDYCKTIPLIGPKRALELVREKSTIENIIEGIGKEKVQNADLYLKSVEAARRVFRDGSRDCAVRQEDLKISAAQEDAAVQFLVEQLQFDPASARSRVGKYAAARKAVKQTTLDGFLKKLK